MRLRAHKHNVLHRMRRGCNLGLRPFWRWETRREREIMEMMRPFQDRLMRAFTDMVVSGSGEYKALTYGEVMSFATEGDGYEAITGHRSAVLDGKTP